ncbi:MAG: nuclear transport factor 2 family protein [Candidatus Limnocylindria bacterium]
MLAPAAKSLSIRGRAMLLACGLGWLLAFFGHASAQEQEPTPRESEAEAIRSVVDGFHAALSIDDSTRALVYLNDDLIVYESGHAETLEEYRSGHLASDIAFSRSVVFTTERDTVVTGRDLAFYLREYSMKGSYRGEAIEARGVESMVLARTEGGWKIRHIHWSSR